MCYFKVIYTIMAIPLPSVNQFLVQLSSLSNTGTPYLQTCRPQMHVFSYPTAINNTLKNVKNLQKREGKAILMFNQSINELQKYTMPTFLQKYQCVYFTCLIHLCRMVSCNMSSFANSPKI